MNAKPLHFWCAYPDDLLDPNVARACAALLTKAELERCQRYKFEQHRRESLASRALIRSALSQYRTVVPTAWRFRKNEHGKPYLDSDCGLHFNLSNSVGMVVCAIAEGIEVGVDVEPHERAHNIMAVAERVFSLAERAQLNELGATEKLDRVLSLWTLKEAYIKARGMGLAMPLEKISFLYECHQGARLEIDSGVDEDPARWRFCSFDHAGHRIAVVVEQRADPQMRLWEARPPNAQPFLLDRVEVPWYPIDFKGLNRLASLA
jgi:4'-phosphopantetheinyl transferase